MGRLRKIRKGLMKEMNTCNKLSVDNVNTIQQKIKFLSEVFNHYTRGDIQLEELYIYNSIFVDVGKHLSKYLSSNDSVLEFCDEFIEICNIYYTNSLDGSVLIPDALFDKVVTEYILNGGEAKPYLKRQSISSEWPKRDHKYPALIGTIGRKMYTFDETLQYANTLPDNEYIEFRFAPKFDGISIDLEIRNGVLIDAITRGDTYIGNQVIGVAASCENIGQILETNAKFTGHIRCEAAMSTSNFNTVKQITKYANRRSAVSAIFSSPKNMALSPYVTLIPLFYYDTVNNDLQYKPMIYNDIKVHYAADLYDVFMEFCDMWKSGTFPFRVDGVVCYPLIKEARGLNTFGDYIAAWKINTSKAKTRIRKIFLSVGKLGKITPMAEVDPVEVNETTVSKASLHSIPRAMSLMLHYDDEVIIESAGDVIPYLTTDSTCYRSENPLIPIDMQCPVCGEKLWSINDEYYCNNKDCPKIKAGMITNFLTKLGIENVSDKTIENLYNNNVIRELVDVFSLTPAQIMDGERFGEISAANIISAVNAIQKKAIPLFKFIGALGIPKVSEITAKKIVNNVDFKTINDFFDDEDTVFSKLVNMKDVGSVLASNIVNFFKDHKKEVISCFNVMNIDQSATESKPTVVFTGGKDSSLIQEIDSVGGFDISDTFDKNTVMLIIPYKGYQSNKVDRAIRKDIPIFEQSQVLEIIDELKAIKRRNNI